MLTGVTLDGPTSHTLAIGANHLHRAPIHNGSALLTLGHFNLTNDFSYYGISGGCFHGTGNVELQNCTRTTSLSFGAVMKSRSRCER